MTLSSAAVTLNTATGGAGGTGGDDGQGVGGGVYNNSGTFTRLQSLIKFTRASTSNDDTFGV